MLVRKITTLVSFCLLVAQSSTYLLPHYQECKHPGTQSLEFECQFDQYSAHFYTVKANICDTCLWDYLVRIPKMNNPSDWHSHVKAMLNPTDHNLFESHEIMVTGEKESAQMYANWLYKGYKKILCHFIKRFGQPENVKTSPIGLPACIINFVQHYQDAGNYTFCSPEYVEVVARSTRLAE